MPEYWTIQQAEANAELLAREFGNRQILLYGFGEPTIQVPIGVEYEDRSTPIPERHRKVGKGRLDWKPVLLIEAATDEEVLSGTSKVKMVTPATLVICLMGIVTERIVGLKQKTVDVKRKVEVCGASIE